MYEMLFDEVWVYVDENNMTCADNLLHDLCLGASVDIHFLR